MPRLRPAVRFAESPPLPPGSALVSPYFYPAHLIPLEYVCYPALTHRYVAPLPSVTGRPDSYRRRHAVAPFVARPGALPEQQFPLPQPRLDRVPVRAYARRHRARRHRPAVRRGSTYSLLVAVPLVYPSAPVINVSAPPVCCCPVCLPRTCRFRLARTCRVRIPGAVRRRSRRVSLRARAASSIREFAREVIFFFALCSVFVDPPHVPEPVAVHFVRKTRKRRNVCIRGSGLCWKRFGVYITDFVDVEDPEHVTVEQFLEAFDAAVDEMGGFSWLPFIKLETDADGDWHVADARWFSSNSLRVGDNYQRLLEELEPQGFVFLDVAIQRLRDGPSYVLVASGEHDDEIAANPLDPTLDLAAAVGSGARVLGDSFRQRLGHVVPPGLEPPASLPPPDNLVPLPHIDPHFPDLLPLPDIPFPVNPVEPLPPIDPSLPVIVPGEPVLGPLEVPDPTLIVPPLPNGDLMFHVPIVTALLPDWMVAFADHLAAAGFLVTDIIRALWSDVVVPAPFIMPALRIYAYYSQNVVGIHSPAFVYDHVKIGKPPHMLPEREICSYAARFALRRLPGCQFDGVDPWLKRLDEEVASFEPQAGNANGRAVLSAEVRANVDAAIRARNTYPLICVSSSVPRHEIQRLQDTFPAFRVHPCTSSHTHSIPDAVRRIFVHMWSDSIARFGFNRVHGVGLSPLQASQFDGLCHNCGPVLSGRDYYRQNYEYSAADRAAFARVSIDHKFQDCDQCTAGDVVLAPFSAHDISVLEFAQSMIRVRQNRAWVAVNLPVPFLDDRVSKYVDPLNHLLYQRRGDFIDMSYLSGAAAGYRQRAEACLSWCSPAPLIEGYQVLVEEKARYGTTFWLEVRVAPGPAEVVPTTFTSGLEEFLVLPLLQPSWRIGEDCDRDFAVPERRFRALVSFLSTLPPGDLKFNAAANKLRGQLAEVRIGSTLIENRLDLNMPEFFSFVGHALLAREMFADDYQEVYGRYRSHFSDVRRRRSSNLILRYAQYCSDIFSFSLNRKRMPWEPTPVERILNALTGTRLDRDEHFNPYHSRLRHRLLTKPAPAPPPRLLEDVDKVYSGFSFVSRYAVELARNLKRPRFGPSGPGAADFDRLRRRARAEHIQCLDDQQRFLERLRGELVQNVPPPPVLSSPPRRVVPPEDVPLPPSPASTLTINHTPGTSLYVTDSESDGTPHLATPLAVNPAFVPLPPSPLVFDPTMLVDKPNVFVPPTPLDLADLDSRLRSLAALVAERDLPPPVAPPDSGSSSSDSSSGVITVDSDYFEDESPSPPVLRPPPQVDVQTGYFVIPDAPDLAYNEFMITAERDTSIFAPEVNLFPRLDTSTSPGSAEFYDAHPNLTSVMKLIASGQFDINAPDQGLVQLVSLAYEQKPRRFSNDAWPVRFRKVDRKSEPILDHELDGLNESEALAVKIRTFFSSRSVRHPMTAPSLVISGVPSSGKSSVLRQFLRTRKDVDRVLVVVPSRTLRSEWIEKAGNLPVLVVTQHTALAASRSFKLVILDEAFSYSRKVLAAWMSFCTVFGAKLILIGDPLQRSIRADAACPDVDDPLFSTRRLFLRVSNSVPLDAWALLGRVAKLNLGLYRTRSPVYRSVLLAGMSPQRLFEVNLSDRLVIKLRKDVASVRPEAVSIGSSQGSRVQHAVVDFGMTVRGHNWLRADPGLMIVALSRHERSVILVAESTAAFFAFFDGVPHRQYLVVNGDRLLRGPGERRRDPFEIDVIPRTIPAAPVAPSAPAVPLSVSHTITEVLQSVSRIDVSEIQLVDSEIAVLPIPTHDEVVGFVARHTNFDNFRDHEHAVDCILPATGRAMHSIGEVGPVHRHENLRLPIPDADKLAEVQKSSDVFYDIYNMASRQFATSKSYVPPAAVTANATAMFRRFMEAFGGGSGLVHVGVNDYLTEWLHKREPSFRARLADSVFGEDRRSVAFSAFLKSQTKAKPVPGFAATLNYGQTVITNDASYSAVMGQYSGLAYENFQSILRPGVIADYGFSDSELSKIMTLTGLHQRFSSGLNMQIDISRQDSSHTAVHVLAFCMLLEYLGVPRDVVNLYFEMRASYRVRSMGTELFSGLIHFNLPSGDPFTLLANIVQMLMTIACRYVEAETAVGLFKGDDATLDRWLRTPHRLAIMPEVAAVGLKEDFDLAFYHAGRFDNGRRLIADPVRCALKLLVRAYDENVSVRDYYVSYLDRATDFREDEIDFLRYSCMQRYTAYDMEDIDFLISLCLAARSSQFFFWLHSARVDRTTLYTARTDCSRAVARLVFPGRPRRFYEKFVGLDSAALAVLFLQYGVVPHVSRSDDGMIAGGPGVHITPDHCYLIVPTDLIAEHGHSAPAKAARLNTVENLFGSS